MNVLASKQHVNDSIRRVPTHTHIHARTYPHTHTHTTTRARTKHTHSRMNPRMLYIDVVCTNEFSTLQVFDAMRLAGWQARVIRSVSRRAEWTGHVCTHALLSDVPTRHARVLFCQNTHTHTRNRYTQSRHTLPCVYKLFTRASQTPHLHLRTRMVRFERARCVCYAAAVAKRAKRLARPTRFTRLKSVRRATTTKPTVDVGGVVRG